jgi:hypothetical protein
MAELTFCREYNIPVIHFDLLHVVMAIVLGATEFLAFDARHAALAKAAGLKVKP